jgi:DNA-binding PadR family transcriptional regulator
VQDLDRFGRFLEPALLILVSLADGPKHGYAMIVDIERVCAVRLGAGTLYGALTRLENAGWIAALPTTDRRQPYELTDSGRRLLRQQLSRLQTVTATGLHRLGQV